MAQHDYIIDNQTSASLRADLNNALAAIVSQNSGATAPATTYANQFWYDTSTDLLKQRNETNTVWITLGTVDQTNNKFEPNQTFATQAEAEGKTDNTKAMTALRTEQAIASRLNVSGTAPIYGARAWANFDARNLTTGASAPIRSSGNIASIVGHSSGPNVWTVNFITPMPNANYVVIGGGTNNSGAQPIVLSTVINSSSGPHASKTTTSVRIQTSNTDFDNNEDSWDCNIVIFG